LIIQVIPAYSADDYFDVGARVYSDTDLYTEQGVPYLVPFNQERYDTDAIHSESVNLTKLFCRTAGKYQIFANIAFDNNNVGYRSVSIMLNGLTRIAYEVQYNNSTTFYTAINISTFYNMNVNDYVEVEAYQNSGGNLMLKKYQNTGIEAGMQRIGTGGETVDVNITSPLEIDINIGIIGICLGIALIVINIKLKSPLIWLAAMVCFIGVYYDPFFFDTYYQVGAGIVMVACIIAAFFQYRSNRNGNYG
jgi:hypothetical protein